MLALVSMMLEALLVLLLVALQSVLVLVWIVGVVLDGAVALSVLLVLVVDDVVSPPY